MTTLAFASKFLHRDKTHKLTLRARAKLLVFKLSFGHIGGLAAVGGYFFVLQILHGQHTTVFNQGVTLPDIKWAWDHLLDSIIPIQSVSQWTVTRHLIRPLYEGIFGGLLYALVAFNPYKVKVKPQPSKLSRAEMASRFIPTVYRPVTALQMIALPLTITLFSIPGVAVGYGVDQLLHVILHVKSLAPALAAHPSVVDKFYSGAFDAKVIGVFASFMFAKRPAKPVFNFVLRYFAQRRALSGKKTRFYHPPTFKMLVDDYRRTSQSELLRKQERHSGAVHVLVFGLSAFVAGLAGLGYYVLRFIA